MSINVETKIIVINNDFNFFLFFFRLTLISSMKHDFSTNMSPLPKLID